MSRVETVWRFLVGPPLRARQVTKEQITPVEGLPALSLDALTSVAYGPEAIVVVLAAAGAAALPLVLPVTIAIFGLLAILVFSYRQVIDAYPGGGGTYAVCRANFAPSVSLLGAAALVVDYTLTVAVSIAAGVATLTSAFRGLTPATVPICLGVLALITLLNLRGLADTARAFLLPTMVFIIGLLAVIAVGLLHPLGLRAPQPGRSLVPAQDLHTVGVLLVLKAFSSGCSALTGVEAIANGVPLFKQPRVDRAKRTELLLGGTLAAMLLGLAVLARRWQIGPRWGPTVLSQIIATAVGRNWAYYVMSVTITVVLMLQQHWARWDPGVPLRILHTEYASVTHPVARFIDELHERHDGEIVVLIPVALPERLRYQFLHNHLDVALTAALKTRPDVIVATTPMNMDLNDT